MTKNNDDPKNNALLKDPFFMQLQKGIYPKGRNSQLTLFDVYQWPEDTRPLPNDYARSALFTVQRGKRKTCEQTVIFSANSDIEITYTGVELRAQDDELVWLQLLELSKNIPIGQDIEFTTYSICKACNWATSAAYYKKVEECLHRLKATAITLKSKRIKMLDSFSLISHFSGKYVGEKCSIFVVQIDPQIKMLFHNQKYTQLIWNKYLGMNATTRRLYDYIASHKEPYPIKLSTLQKILGSNEVSRNFTLRIKKSCSYLVEEKLIQDWEVKSDTLYVSR